MFPRKARDPHGDWLRILIGRQRQAKEEVVPHRDEREDGCREDPRGGQRHNHFPQRTHARGPIYQRRLFQVGRQIAEERGHEPHRDRQGQHQVGDDQGGIRVVDGQRTREDHVERPHHGDQRDDGHRQGDAQHQRFAAELHARHRIGAQNAKEQGQ